MADGGQYVDNAPQSLREEIRRLLAQQTGGSERPEDLFSALEKACVQLNQTLGMSIGPAGYDALFARAFQSARIEFPFLQEIEGSSKNCVSSEDLLRVARQRDKEHVVAASVAILANVIWTLSTLVGIDLTLIHFRFVWPDFPFDRAAFRDSKTTLSQAAGRAFRVVTPSGG